MVAAHDGAVEEALEAEAAVDGEERSRQAARAIIELRNHNKFSSCFPARPILSSESSIEERAPAMRFPCGAGRSLLFLLVPVRWDRHSDGSRRLLSATLPMIATILIFASACNPAFCAPAEQPGFQKLFHLAGVPGLRRDDRVNLVLNPDGLVFQTKKVRYQVPYARIHQILLLHADRRYEGGTYLAALATYGVGSLFILKKHHVDTVVLDYSNEHGGKMGIVVQMDPDQADIFKELMKTHGTPIEEPQGLPEPPVTGPASN